MKKLMSFIISIVLFFASISLLNIFLENGIDRNYNSRISSTYGSVEKNKGITLQSIGLNRDDLMIYGSSELGVNIKQNPKNFFNEKKDAFIVNTVGRGNCQSLHHGINLGALENALQRKKGVFVVSIQWFFRDGISKEKFLMNFSDYQFLKLMNNNKISKKNKIKICNRIYNLVGEDSNFKDVAIYCDLYKSNSKLKNAIFYILKPYYRFKEFVLKTEDNIKSYKVMKKNINMKEEKNGIKLKDIDWENEYNKAENQGKQLAKNNEFFIEDKYFDTNYKDKLDMLSGYSKDTELFKSEEYDDFKLMLDICKEIDFRPLFVVMPTNGRWYDYIGIDKNKRNKFYNDVSHIILEKGFEVTTYEKCEYEPYFMKDGMHLGWKGWLRVDEDINKYYYKDEK